MKESLPSVLRIDGLKYWIVAFIAFKWRINRTNILFHVQFKQYDLSEKTVVPKGGTYYLFTIETNSSTLRSESGVVQGVHVIPCKYLANYKSPLLSAHKITNDIGNTPV